MDEVGTPALGPQRFYVVSPAKFTILFFATLGVYQVYWFYKNWSYYRNATGVAVWPIARGIFLIFFVGSLFGEVNRRIVESGRTYRWAYEGLAAGIVFAMLASKGLDYMASKSIGNPYSDILSLLLAPLVFALMLPAQHAINFAEGDPLGERNSRLTFFNYLWIFIGLLLWIGCFLEIADLGPVD